MISNLLVCIVALQLVQLTFGDRLLSSFIWYLRGRFSVKHIVMQQQPESKANYSARERLGPKGVKLSYDVINSIVTEPQTQIMKQSPASCDIRVRAFAAESPIAFSETSLLAMSSHVWEVVATYRDALIADDLGI